MNKEQKINFRVTSNMCIEIRHFYCPACEQKLYELVDWESEQCVYCGQEFHGEIPADYEPDEYYLIVDPKTGVPSVIEGGPEDE